MFKKLSLIFALAFGLCLCGTTEVQAQNVPDEYIYFDLAAGNVTIGASTYTGYVYVEGSSKKVTGTHYDANKYYIYQSSTAAGSPGLAANTGYATQADFNAMQNIRIPNYSAMTAEGKTWGEFITDNTDTEGVASQWTTSAGNALRTGTANTIKISGTTNTYDITIDNLWSTYNPDIESVSDKSGIHISSSSGKTATVTLRMKNDSRFTNIYYHRNSEKAGSLTFTSADGDNSTNGTLTVIQTSADWKANDQEFAVIGGYYDTHDTGTYADSYGMYVKGGTMYVGKSPIQNSNWTSAVSNDQDGCFGGGATGDGEITIDGGIVTAVNHTTSAAIGGGAALKMPAGNGYVTINGGKVYAYSFGVYSQERGGVIACTAIGSGSTGGRSDHPGEGAGDGTVTINGGEVYAKSIGGTAIGGGNSTKARGGDGTIIITGGTVTAISAGGTIAAGTSNATTLTASNSIGGGTGGNTANAATTGGDARVTISGSPIIRAGSVGGGKTNNNIAKIGAACVDITGNPDISAQFLLVEGAAITPYFNMSGGTIHDSKTNDAVYEKVEKNRGGAVYLEDGDCTITGGQIYGCEATEYGGAIFVKGGSVTISGGDVGALSTPEEPKNPNKAQQGGGVYVDNGNISISAGKISNNTATADGGGFYVNGGSVTITGGNVLNNIATTGNGGGFYSAGGTINITNATISGNHADSGNGGGLYSAAAITVGTNASGSGATVSGNHAKNGAGFYVKAASSTATTIIQGGSTISGNIATEDGAGAYIESGNLLVNSSTVKGNQANSGNGGGFYSTAEITISGNSSITGNTAGDSGGGVYVGGTIKLGAGNLTVMENHCGSHSVKNNIYLPTNKELTVINDDFNPQYVGIYAENTADYFAVINSESPATASTLQTIYNGLLDGTCNVFDDKQTYSPAYNETWQEVTIPNTEIYFIKTPWTPLQRQITAAADLKLIAGSTDTYEVKDVKSLTAFLWYVNGITDIVTGAPFNEKHPSAKAKVTADIPMVGRYWVPIGTSDEPFTGTFDGGGHIISDLTMVAANASTEYGMFGNVGANADIKNVVLRDCLFTGTDDYAGSMVYKMNGGTLSNCQAHGVVNTAQANCTIGGLVGYAGGGEIHSCYSCVELSGYNMGGLVGQTASDGNLKNSFANAKFQYAGSDNTEYVGGLVGINAGTVENCYVRGLQTGSAPGSNFGWLVGNNSGNVNKSYAPNNDYNYATSGTVGEYCGTFTAPKIFSHDIAHDNRVSNDRLVYLLNDYVAHTNAASKDAVLDSWILPTTTTVNGGLPVLKPSGTIAVGSTDGTALEYARNEDELVAMLNGYATGGISLYANADLSGKTVTQGNATFAIHPSASLLQGANSANIRALVSIPMQYTSGTKYYHGISSPIASWPLGFAYGNTAQVAYNDNKNPCLAYMGIADGIFPQDVNLDAPTVTSSLPWDFYDFQESTSHWVNYRRNSLSHWDEQDHDLNLGYTNHTTMQAAKGYLAALALPSDFNNDSILLQHEGMLNYGSISVPVTNHAYAYHHGINMIGNPYESYLDFNVLASTNSALWTSGNQFYGAYDKDNGFVYYAPGASEDYPYTASRYIHKHQGFFVRLDNCAETGNSMQFTESMRTNDGTPHFRDWERNYPLVNLIVTDSEGATDVCVVEMNRPDEGGALKLVPMVMSNGVLYAHRNGNDYGIVFTDGQENVPLWFETNASENFTLTWNTRHGEFSYLHLIDNIAGADIDMLASQQYTFAANANDYKSRFKLVCQCTGVDENADTDTEHAEAFAFVNDGQLIVNGDGLLQIFDLNGRMLQQTMLDGAMNTVSLPEMAAGLYILKLDGKAQKIVME